MVCYLPVTHMIFYKSDRQILISKDENAAKTRTVTFLEVKFGLVINGIVDATAGHGSVDYRCCP